MKINILRIVLLILLIGTMYIIFGFSSQNGEESSSISRAITEEITKNIKAIQKLEKNEKKEVLAKIEHFIRKLAHFSLYTVIGMLTMSLISTYKLKKKKKIVLSGTIGTIYAISDEIHQSFIPNRSPEIGDVFIDCMGVALGIAIVLLIIMILKSKKILLKKI